MPAHAITLHLPDTLYERFRQRAEWSRRSVETELLDAIASAASVEAELSPEFLKAAEGLADEELSTLMPTRKERQFGSAKGLIEIADDFDAPLEKFRGL
jgi:plasmid stability protein